jgi:hypothetical protein
MSLNLFIKGQLLLALFNRAGKKGTKTWKSNRRCWSKEIGSCQTCILSYSVGQQKHHDDPHVFSDIQLVTEAPRWSHQNRVQKVYTILKKSGVDSSTAVPRFYSHTKSYASSILALPQEALRTFNHHNHLHACLWILEFMVPLPLSL